MRATCLLNDRTREFVVSSPTNGLKTEQDGYVAKDPYDGKYGDGMLFLKKKYIFFIPESIKHKKKENLGLI